MIGHSIRFLTVAATIGYASVACADDALIWQFSRSSDVAYVARLGSKLPTPWTSSMGTETRIVGPDLRASGNPLSLWASVEVPGLRESPAKSSRLEARLDGRSGRRSMTIVDNATLGYGAFDLSLDRLLLLSLDPSGDAKPHAKLIQSGRVTLKRTNTAVLAQASRGDEERWRTSIAVEQKLRETITLTGSVNRLQGENQTARVRAEWRYNW